ncbi:hypothetical protein [Vitreimonas flagellata]|uniref:hypothetical protein n=1 Tax=Vitreimonas flagellata TaxID=2560861 RepID=UPI0010755F76|nr:hypothetical protein [Vitreimonas flagellata]
MPDYTEQVVDRELRVSLYIDGSFASAEARKRVQVLRDGETVGQPEWQNEPISQEALKTLLGDAAVEQRGHVERVEAQVLQMRADRAAELSALRETHSAALTAAETARQQVIAEANTIIEAKNVALELARARISELEAALAEPAE